MTVKQQFARYLNPLLSVLGDLGGSARPAEARSGVAEHLKLPDEVLADLLPSGSSRFENQVNWARYYLAKSGHIDSSRRGVWALTEKGRSVSSLSDDQINALIQGVVSQWGSREGKGANEVDPDSDDVSPDEVNRDHRVRLVKLLQDLPAEGFERLCQRLLREAGFEQVTVTGRSGDGGIDGIGVLELNTFVSFKVLFQCKRYKGSVGPSTVRDFRGAMMGRADKGLILTTGTFTPDSKREAVRDGVPPIELVDGDGLVDLFERLELGLQPRTTYDVVDSFFDEFRG